MALKADRIETQTDVSFFMDETATRGRICTISSGGSGVAMDDANAKVTARNAAASGSKPVGVLLNDVVNLDLTRQHINFIKMKYKRVARLLFFRLVKLPLIILVELLLLAIQHILELVECSQTLLSLIAIKRIATILSVVS